MTLIKKIFAVFISVLILSMSIGNCFFSTYNISRVYAAEIVLGETAAAGWELFMLFLAEFGVAGAAVSNDSLVNAYCEQIMKEEELNHQLADSIKSGVVKLYDSATNAVSSVSLDEYVEALKEYHNSAVDNLTGIYAKYCPELIGYTRDFAKGIATGAIVVEGVNDDVFFDEKMIEKQWSGEAFDYKADVIYKPSESFTHIYNFAHSYNFPLAGYFINENGYYCLRFYCLENSKISSISLNCNYKFINQNGTYQKKEYTNSVSYNNPLSFSYSLNFPVFSDLEDVESYLKGMNDATGAINWDGVIDNDDLPLWGLSKALSEAIARAPDIGIGTIGAGALVNDWADDIPFVGLTDIQDYIDKVNDVIDGIRDGVIDGTFDLANDIPDSITDPYTDAWDDVIDNAIPSDDPRVKDPTTDKPITGDKPITIPSEDVIDLPLLVPDVTSDFSDISDSLKTKFPFSLPWDLHYLLTGLASTPKTPVYYLPLVIERLGINETIVVDMSDFEELSRLSRAMLSFIWAYVLINWTVKIVSVRKEE